MEQARKISATEYLHILPYFAKRFIPLLLLGVVVGFGYYTIDATHTWRQLVLKESSRVTLAKRAIETDIAGVVSELRYLAESQVLEQYIATRSEAARRDAEIEFLSFARHFTRYQQIRWLDLKGREGVRVDMRDGIVMGVAKDDLQDKSQRYYFVDAMALPADTIYISPMDLNVEYGEIEKPYRPMIRLAMSTRDTTGARSGLVVLNYDATQLLHDFAKFGSDTDGTLQLLNQDGDWLYHPQNNQAFRFLLGGNESFAANFPRAWSNIRNRSHGQLDWENGLFTFAAVDMKEMARGADINGTAGIRFALPSKMLMVLSHLKPKSTLNFDNNHIRIYTKALVMLLLISAIIVWRLARARWEKDQLLDRLALHARVMETSTNGVIITDTKQHIVSVNPAFSELTGYSAKEVLGKMPTLLASGRHDKAFFRQMWHELNTAGQWEGEIWNRHKSGEIYPEWLRISTLKDRKGQIANYLGVFSVLSQQKGTTERLRALANTDPLTGLINRNLLYDRAEQVLSQCRRNECHAAFFFLDLDGFKPINDELGHAAGDWVLRQVARRLQQCVRDSDTVARFGGDEFVLLLHDINDHESAAEVAQKILDNISVEIAVEENNRQVGASIGISLYPQDGNNAEQLLQAADQAMYRAKSEGRHRYLFADANP